MGDYDGVISQMDVSSGHLLADRDEPSGKRYARSCLDHDLGSFGPAISVCCLLQLPGPAPGTTLLQSSCWTAHVACTAVIGSEHL